MSKRRCRAAVAERLLAGAPAPARALDWDELDSAPDWLALPEADFNAFQCRVGAVLCGRALRLWIDRGRLAAAQAALGAPFMEALLAQPDSTLLALDLFACPDIEVPAQVEPALRLSGASLLLATLPAGALREAVAVLLAPAIASRMVPALAASIVARAESLGRTEVAS